MLMGVSALVLLLFCVVDTRAFTDEEKAYWIKSKGDCLDESGADKTTVDNILKGIVPDDPVIKKYIHCFFVKVGMINDADEFNVKYIKEKAAHEIGEEAADQFIQSCFSSTEISGVNHEHTFDLTKCYTVMNPDTLKWLQ